MTNIKYDVLHEFATKRKVDYNELCATIRAALAVPAPFQCLHQIQEPSEQVVLPEPVAWRYLPSKVWAQLEITQDKERAQLVREHGINLEPLYTEQQVRALLATGGQAQAYCERCKGSGEDPEGHYDQSLGPDGDTHEGPCRKCNGTGDAQ